MLKNLPETLDFRERFGTMDDLTAYLRSESVSGITPDVALCASIDIGTPTQDQAVYYDAADIQFSPSHS